MRTLKERVEELYRTDARAARELAECVFLAAERCGDLESMALGHRARALAALASGSRKEALAHYEAAERLYQWHGDEVERAKVLRSMIDALMHLGRYEEALAAGREAGEVFRRHQLPVLAAQVEANVGSVFHRLDRNAESLESYERALRTFREAGDEEAVAMMEFNRANVFSNLDELGEAERGYRRALGYYRAGGFRLREAQCLYALAYLAFLRSRASESLRLFQRVKELDLELGDVRHAALCDLDQAEVLLSLNAWREACELGSDAQRAFEELGMGTEAAKAVLYRGLGAVHLRHDQRAAGFLEDAGRRFSREGNEVYRGLTDLYRAELALRQGDAATAFALARASIGLFSREGLRTKLAYARVLAARSLSALGRKASARRQCFLALEDLQASPSAWVAASARHLLGRLEPDATAARRHLEEALGLVERLRANVLPDELHASFQRDKVGLYEDYARLLLERGGNGGAGRAPDAVRLAEAFGVLEKAKSRTLSDFLSRFAFEEESEASRRAGGHLGEWRRQLEELNSCYRRLNEAEAGGRSRSAGETLRREIDEREARLAQLFRTIQLGGPARQATPFEADRGMLPRVQRLLEEDEALVEFFFLGPELHAFAVRPGAVRWVPKIALRRQLREALDGWRFQAEKTHLGREYLASHRAALRAGSLYYLDRLARLIWEPLADALGDARKIVVVPAGPLFYVPFHALRRGERFLVQDFEVSQAASAQAYILAHRLRPGQRGRPNPPLVLGLERPELPAIAAEIKAVRERLPEARVLMGAEARRSALRRFGDGAPVIHIASHARFRGDNPLLSAIELADGWLTFYDLFDLRLGSELVVLSGCETGRQDVLEGDELMGLARGFLYAGAATLLASLWPVDDSVTAQFMERFYASLQEGCGPRFAARKAMCDLIESGLDPHEWAAFYLTGRPR